MTTPARLTVEDGLIELPGEEPTWIWAHTCSMPKCDCRSAFIVATSHGRQALLERARLVDEAWRAGARYVDVAARLEGVEVFHINIDTVEVSTPANDEPLVLADHPKVRAIVGRLDGEVLDGIGCLWYRGKGKPDPEAQSRAAKQIVIREWKPGETLAYDEVLGGVRADFYKLDGRLYEALDLYCVVPGCTCGEVILDMTTVVPRGGPHLGRVVVERSGAVRIEARGNGSERLAQVWTAFQKRHPMYRERLARREAVMKEIGARIVADAAATIHAPAARGRSTRSAAGRRRRR
jgi:hypothetical protein